MQTELKKEHRLLAVYDLYSYAPTFNIYEFLTGAKIHADKNKIEIIDLLILKRKLYDSVIIQPQGNAEYNFRIDDILIGSKAMFPIKSTFVISKEEEAKKILNLYKYIYPPEYKLEITDAKKDYDRYYLQPYLRDHFMAGEVIPSISIPAFSYKLIKNIIKNNRKIITITIRNAKHIPAKNSNQSTWLIVANYFKKYGYEIITIPDIENLHQDDKNYLEPISYLSISNQSYRAALYDAAFLNLCVSNGAINPITFNANARMVVAKVYTENANTNMKAVVDLTGVNSENGSWTRVPWHKFIFNDKEDSDEIIYYSKNIIEIINETEKSLEIEGGIHSLFLDPWGKLDGYIYFLLMKVKTDNDVLVDITNKLLAEDGYFKSSKTLILKSLSALFNNKQDVSMMYAKKAITNESRYADPYIILSHIESKLGNQMSSSKYLQSLSELPTLFFTLVNDSWELKLNNKIKEKLINHR